MSKKRKRDDDLNESLPDGPTHEGAMLGSMEFNEVLDEQVCVLDKSQVQLDVVYSCAVGIKDKVSGREPCTCDVRLGDYRSGTVGVQARRGTKYR